MFYNHLVVIVCVLGESAKEVACRAHPRTIDIRKKAQRENLTIMANSYKICVFWSVGWAGPNYAIFSNEWQFYSWKALLQRHSKCQEKLPNICSQALDTYWLQSVTYLYQIRYVSMPIQDNSMHFSSIYLLPQAILTSGCSGSGWGGCTGQEEHALHLTILSFVCLG